MAYDPRAFWEKRYAAGGTSGAGSAGAEAAWKIERIVAAAKAHDARSVLDLGHGDGVIARAVMHALPGATYRGIDLSPTAVARCRRAAPGLSFSVGDLLTTPLPRADLVICADVLFHLPTPEAHDRATAVIVAAARKVAVVAAWNEGIVRQYGGRFADHTFFRPFRPPAGLAVSAEILPMTPSKTLFTITGMTP